MGAHNTVTISPRVARHVTYKLIGDPHVGVDGGDFANALIVAITKADLENQAKLATVFPEYVAAVVTFQREPGGLDIIRERAREIELPVHLAPAACSVCGRPEHLEQIEGHVYWSNADAAREFAQLPGGTVPSMTAVETLDPREAARA